MRQSRKSEQLPLREIEEYSFVIVLIYNKVNNIILLIVIIYRFGYAPNGYTYFVAELWLPERQIYRALGWLEYYHLAYQV